MARGGCSRGLWLDLARLRAQQHPADAIPVFQREILAAVAGGKRSAYRAGAQLATELGGYAERAGKSSDFGVWIRKDTQ